MNKEIRIGSYHGVESEGIVMFPASLVGTSFSQEKTGVGITVIFSNHNPGVFPHAVSVTTRKTGKLIGESFGSGQTVVDALRGITPPIRQEITQRFSKGKAV